MLDFDSSDSNIFPRDNLGWATIIEGDPVVKVTPSFFSDMQYPAFYIDRRIIFFALSNFSNITYFLVTLPRIRVFLFDPWDELKNAVATNNFWGSESISWK